MSSLECLWHNKSLSFCGCGFLGIYHLGAAIAIRKFSPECFKGKICGASAGSLAAAAIVCKLDLNSSIIRVLDIAIKARQNLLGSFSSKFNITKILNDLLNDLLPDDCHITATDRLLISVTETQTFKNKLICKYNSKADLIQAIVCSCFIPGWSGNKYPKFNGIEYIDGFFSDNHPKLDENTITVSPLNSSVDICPTDESIKLLECVEIHSSQLAKYVKNVYRHKCILLPPHPEELVTMLKQGFRDAINYLIKNNKIHCFACLTVENELSRSDLRVIDEVEIIDVNSDVIMSSVDLPRENDKVSGGGVQDKRLYSISQSDSSLVSIIWSLLSLEKVEKLRRVFLQNGMEAGKEVLALFRGILWDVFNQIPFLPYVIQLFAESFSRFIDLFCAVVAKYFFDQSISSRRIDFGCYFQYTAEHNLNQCNRTSEYYGRDFMSELMSIVPPNVRKSRPKHAIVKRAAKVTQSEGNSKQHLDVKNKTVLKLSRRNSFSQIECCSGQHFAEDVTRDYTKRYSLDITFSLSYNLNSKSDEKIYKTCETCGKIVKSGIHRNHTKENAHDIYDVIAFTQTRDEILIFYYMNEYEPEVEPPLSPNWVCVSGNTTSPEKTL